MKKIFYVKTNDCKSTRETLQKILFAKFAIENPMVEKSENGKPYLSQTGEPPLHFSISHTDELTFFVFSDKNVGVDAEKLTRKVEYAPIIKKFKEEERAEILSKTEFLRHWTAKESAVKWLGGRLGKDLNSLQFVKHELYYKCVPLPIYVCFFEFEEHIVAICGENDFSGAQIEQFFE